jgi:phosphate transport system substrate-binding protein
MKWIAGLFLAVAAAMLCFSFCAGGRGGREHAINCVGSTSVQPFAEMLSQEFDRLHPDTPVDVQGGGSTAGLQAVAENIAEIGMCSRSLKEDEADKFTGIPIAMDGLAVVVHKSNPINGLNLTQIRDIFRGQITNWQQVGGNDFPIRMITREEGSGTREAFFKLVMEAKDKPAATVQGASPTPVGGQHVPVRISRKAMTQESNGAVKELVKHDRGAIGYMSLGLVKGELKILAVDGVYPSLEEVADKRYPLVRPFLYVVRGKPSAGAGAFIDYTLSPEGQRLLVKEGLISVR